MYEQGFQSKFSQIINMLFQYQLPLNKLLHNRKAKCIET